MKTLIIAEQQDGNLKAATLAAVAFARRVGGPFSILVMGGPEAPAAAEQARAYGAEAVLLASDPVLTHYLAETYTPTVVQAAADFDIMVATATSFGKDLLPRVAAALDAGFAGDCAGVESEGDQWVFKRPMFAGNAYGHVVLSTPQKVVTVRQSEWTAAEASGGSSPVQALTVSAPSAAASRVRFISLDQVQSERPELSEAERIVSGGRALKERFFEVLEPLAKALNAGIGASRAACDAGYAPGDFQVGQTGKIVAPNLYIAIGISGAIQHIAGMKGSKTIVAINKDPEAPIFQIADYGLVADLFDAVPELVKALEARS